MLHGVNCQHYRVKVGTFGTTKPGSCAIGSQAWISIRRNIQIGERKNIHKPLDLRVLLALCQVTGALSEDAFCISIEGRRGQCYQSLHTRDRRGRMKGWFRYVVLSFCQISLDRWCLVYRLAPLIPEGIQFLSEVDILSGGRSRALLRALAAAAPWLSWRQNLCLAVDTGFLLTHYVHRR